MNQYKGGQQQGLFDEIPDVSFYDTPYDYLGATSTFPLNPSHSAISNHDDPNGIVARTHVSHASQVQQSPLKYQHGDYGGQLAASTIPVDPISISFFIRSADDVPWSGARVATEIQSSHYGPDLQLPLDASKSKAKSIGRESSSTNVKRRRTRTRQSSLLSSTIDSGIGGSRNLFEQSHPSQVFQQTTLQSDVARELSRPPPSVASSRSGAAIAHRPARGPKEKERIPDCCGHPFRNQSEAK